MNTLALTSEIFGAGKLVAWRDRMQQLQQVIQAARAKHAQELAMIQAQAQMPMH